MLALFRPRCQLHFSRFQCLRTLRTLPQPIPTYIKRWDPTLHKTNRPRPPTTESIGISRPAPNDATGKAELEIQSDADISVYPIRQEAGARHPVKRLYRLLKTAAKKPKKVDIASLWKVYTMAKAADRTLLKRMPNSMWDTLWAALYTRTPQNNDERARVEQLYRDLHVAGKDTTSGREIEYLESLFLSGREKEALQKWEEVASFLGANSRPEHLELGTKLYALAGDVDRSLAVMDDLYRLHPDWNTSVMMVVFRALTSSGIQRHHDVAKEVYIKMKKHKGTAVTFDDYSSWFVGFLEARHLPFAKQAFRDMVNDGHIATIGDADRVDEVLKRLFMLYRLGTDISNMTSIALDVIAVLPPAYHGHLFGHWMKAAVVHKAPEAAAQILDMMFQRGLKPETFHFNMLMKALLRTKENPNVLKAENIGWHMIEEARRAQKRSSIPSSTAEKIHKRTSSTRIFDMEAVREVPIANVTTFALMMQHHAKTLQWEHVDYLSRQLKESAIVPNATIMNVLMDNKCRQGAYSEAWSIYQTLTNPSEGSTGVFPDGASFRCLWKTLRLALGDHATRNDPTLPTPRELLKEMVAWWTLSRSRYDASRFRQGLAAADGGAITSLIMHCFSYTQDLAGSLIALHVLRQHFDIFPTDKAALILQRQMAWIDMARESDSVRSQHFHGRSNARNAAQIAKIYDILLQRRLARMNLSQEQYEQLSNEEIGDVGLNLLSEFVRVVLKRSYPPEVVEAMIDAVKGVVGMPNLATGDMDAFEVV